jgi:hypothetical protein
MRILFQILTNVLGGKYLPFGVFEAYKDPSLNIAIETFLQLMSGGCLVIDEMLQYAKLAKPYFGLLDVLFSEHWSIVGRSFTNMIVYWNQKKR